MNRETLIGFRVAHPLDIGALYQRYSEVLSSLFGALLPPTEAAEAVNDTFATLHVERDDISGMAEDQIGAHMSLRAYEEFKKRLEDPSMHRLHPVDATRMANAIIDRDETGEVMLDGDVFWTLVEEENAYLEQARNRSQETFNRSTPSFVKADLIANADRNNAPILSAYLSQMESARQLGLGPGQWLAPFARPTLLNPNGSPVSSETAKEIELSAQAVSERMLEMLATSPDRIYELTPRQFEEVVAELFAKQGYGVNLTASSKDGGADLYVIDNSSIGSFLYVVECKRYRADRPVGVGIVRGLFGVVQATRATAGVLATTSYFTRDAKRMEEELRYQLSLRDFSALKTWLKN